MATAFPTASTIPTTAADHLPAVRALAKVMDAAVSIPGTNIKIGLDALLGLLPGVGDAIGAAISSYIVVIARQLGVPTTVIWRMLMNVGMDAVIGAVPFVGDLLDVGWKANLKNVALLEQALSDPQSAKRSSRWALVGLVFVVFLIAALGAGLTWLVIYLVTR